MDSTQKARVRILGTQWCALWVISLYMCVNVKYNFVLLHSFSFSFSFILFPFLYVVSNLFPSPYHFSSSLIFTYTISLLHLPFLIHPHGYSHNHCSHFFSFISCREYPLSLISIFLFFAYSHNLSLISILIPSRFTFSSIPFLFLFSSPISTSGPNYKHPLHSPPLQTT